MYVAMATRDYGEGKVLIHTDRISGRNTGHGKNDLVFWRNVIEFASSKFTREHIDVAYINSTNDDKFADCMATSFVAPLTAIQIDLAYIATNDLDDFDCLYFVGLPDDVNIDVAAKVSDFVNNGGGIVIETPDESGNINILSGIENLNVSSVQPPVFVNAFWTVAGKSHYVFDNKVSVSFLVGLLEIDFSTNWTILLTDVETDKEANIFDPDTVIFTGNSASEIAVSYICAMQKGIVTIIQQSTSSSSSSSSSIDSSSSSSIDSSSSSSIDSSSSSSIDSSSSSSVGFSSSSSSVGFSSSSSSVGFSSSSSSVGFSSSSSSVGFSSSSSSVGFSSSSSS